MLGREGCPPPSSSLVGAGVGTSGAGVGTEAEHLASGWCPSGGSLLLLLLSYCFCRLSFMWWCHPPGCCLSPSSASERTLGRGQREGSVITHAPSTEILPASFVCPSPAAHMPPSGRGAVSAVPGEKVEGGRVPCGTLPVEGGPRFPSTREPLTGVGDAAPDPSPAPIPQSTRGHGHQEPRLAPRCGSQWGCAVCGGLWWASWFEDPIVLSFIPVAAQEGLGEGRQLAHCPSGLGSDAGVRTPVP